MLTYDADGNLTERDEKNTPTGSVVATSSYTYGDLNRRTAESFPGTMSNIYAYDKNGNLCWTVASTATGTCPGTTPGPPSGATSYTYDDINRLLSIASPTSSGSDAASYAYSQSGTSGPSGTTISYPGGLSQETDVDSSGKVVEKRILNSSHTVLSDLKYTYDNATAPHQRALTQTVTNAPADLITAYGYGASYTSGGSGDRLIQAQTKNCAVTMCTPSVVDNRTYEYDKAGDRTRSSHPTGTMGSPTGALSYAYNAANEICWVHASYTDPPTCANSPSGATIYSYDHAGNQLTGSLSYDNLNRLTGISTTSLAFTSPSNDELTGYATTIYQNNLLGLDQDIPSSGSTTTFVRQPDGTAISQIIGSTKQDLFTDALGTDIAVADDGSNTIGRTYTYDPDGPRTTSGSGANTELGLAGGQILPNGFMHFVARFYQPANARFLQPDPDDQIASLQQANRYSYAGGDPINEVDLGGTTYGGPHDSCEGPSYSCYPATPGQPDGDPDEPNPNATTLTSAVDYGCATAAPFLLRSAPAFSVPCVAYGAARANGFIH